MKEVRWDLIKNEKLKSSRGTSFEDLLSTGKLVAAKKHPKKKNQEILLFDYKNYIWIVPYVKQKDGSLFLKTLYPSRKFTKTLKRDE